MSLIWTVCINYWLLNIHCWVIHQQLFCHFYELRVWSLGHFNPKLSLFYLANLVLPIINIYCQLWPINDVQIKWHYIIQSIINQTKLRNVVMLMFTILYLVVLLSLIKIIIEIFAEIVFCGECSPITFSMYVASIETKSCQKHTSSLYKHDLIDISCWHCLIIKIMVPRAVYIQNQKFITKLGLRSDASNINEHSTTWVDSPHRKAPLTWRRVNSVDQKLFAGFHIDHCTIYFASFFFFQIIIIITMHTGMITFNTVINECKNKSKWCLSTTVIDNSTTIFFLLFFFVGQSVKSSK